MPDDDTVLGKPQADKTVEIEGFVLLKEPPGFNESPDDRCDGIKNDPAKKKE